MEFNSKRLLELFKQVFGDDFKAIGASESRARETGDFMWLEVIFRNNERQQVIVTFYEDSIEVGPVYDVNDNEILVEECENLTKILEKEKILIL